MKKAPTKRPANTSADGLYLLKLVLYLLVGSLWLKLQTGNVNIGIPVGLIIGLLIAAHDRAKIDRKIEYAVLIIAMLVGYFAPYGLYLSF